MLDVGQSSLWLELRLSRLASVRVFLLLATDHHAVLASALHARTKDDTYNKTHCRLCWGGCTVEYLSCNWPPSMDYNTSDRMEVL